MRQNVKAFWVEQKLWAERVLKLLDERFEPQVFPVGVPFGNSEEDCLPWVEPRDDFWISSETFASAAESATLAFQSSRDLKVLFSSHAAQLWHDYGYLRSALKDAVQQSIIQHAERDQGMEYFVSVPEMVNHYMVSVVIGLQAEVLSSHYKLKRSGLVLWEYREVEVVRSLVEAAIKEVFLSAAEELKKHDPGFPTDIRRDPEELIRLAGRRLAYDTAVRVDEQAHEGWYSLFRACTTISSLKYEQAVGVGRMVVARKGHEAVRPLVLFAADLRLNEFRGARKLLELASSGPVLHTDSVAVFGLVGVGEYRSEEEDFFEVNFLEHHHWELAHAGHVLMRVKYGTPYLPKAPTYLEKLRKDLPRIFKGISREEIDLLLLLVRQAEQESHGTMLLVTPAAEDEAKRLSAQGSAIKPVLLTPDLLKSLTRIDGAVILEPSGHCHAIGVILDGLASELGDPTRGARYNSALRYVTSYYATAPCLAVVVSVDGGVSLIPDLRPQVRRSAIEEALMRLSSAVQEGQVSWRRYHSSMEWLSKHRFYLREEDCDLINRSMSAFAEWVGREAPMQPRLVYETFMGDSDLDEELYYEPADDV